MPLLREDAVWTWFHMPQALRDGDATYLTWCSTTGIHIGRLDDATGDFDTFQLKAHSGTPDDHNVAAVGIRPDGRLIAAYSEHNDSAMRVRISVNPGDVSEWDAEITAALPVGATGITYPNLIHLASEGRWFLFYRDFPDPTYITSDDDGETWSAPTIWADNSPERPYVRYATDGIDQIHILMTDKHPANTQASIYHLRYDAGTWRNSNGVDAGALPIPFANMTQIHDGVTGNNSWIWDIALDGSTPAIAYTTFPSTADHRYHYGRLTDGAWVTHEVAAAGGAIDTSGQEPFYSAGIGIDHTDPNAVYLALPRNPGSWDIQRWTTADGGATWPVTQDIAVGGKNMRPMSVRSGASAEVVWFSGNYTHFTDFDTDMFHLEVSPAPPPPPPPSPPPVATAVIRRRITWLGVHAVTGRVIAELPDVQGEVSRLLSAHQSSRLTLPIPLAGPSAVDIAITEQATQPLGTCLVAVVNDLPTWMGWVLARRGGTGAEMQLATVTPEAYLLRRRVRDHAFVDLDRTTVAVRLLDDAGDLAGVGAGLGFEVVEELTGDIISREYLASDRTTVYDAWRELAADGLEFTVDLDWEDSTRTVVRRIMRLGPRVGKPGGSVLFETTASSMFESQAGSEATYELMEDHTSGKSANHITVIAPGEGEDQPASVPAIDQGALDGGLPIVEDVIQVSSAAAIHQNALNAQAQAELVRLRRGAQVWEISARLDAYPRPGIDAQIGDDVSFQLTGHRHPRGVSGTRRMIGYTLDQQAGTWRPILLQPGEEVVS